MDRHTLEDGVVLSQLKTLGRILSVLGRDVAGRPWHTTLLVLSALEDDLYSVPLAFFAMIFLLLYFDFT